MHLNTIDMSSQIIAGKREVEKFDGKDYTIWVIHMKNILRERKLLKYVEGDAIQNYDEEEDKQALAEIQFMLSNGQMRHVMHCTTAKDAWIS